MGLIQQRQVGESLILEVAGEMIEVYVSEVRGLSGGVPRVLLDIIAPPDTVKIWRNEIYPGECYAGNQSAKAREFSGNDETRSRSQRRQRSRSDRVGQDEGRLPHHEPLRTPEDR